MTKEEKQHEELVQIIKYGKCMCGNAGEEEHTCPYYEEINDDSISLCNCCNSCTRECIDDI